MCKAKPHPRCPGHAREALDKHHQFHPGLAGLTDHQVALAAHAEAVKANQYSKARILSREMDLRLDVDATTEGIAQLREHLKANPTDSEAWYRFNVAQATFAAKTTYAQAHQPLAPRDDDARTLVERRERLARLEGRMAGWATLRGHLAGSQIAELCREYEATLQAEAHARLRAANGEPDPTFATARDMRSWKSATQGAKDGLPGMTAQAHEFAARSHRERAISTWGYAHLAPPEPYGRARKLTGTALDAVHVAALTRCPVRWDAGAIEVQTKDPEQVRALLWHAGYPLATPHGPVVVRPAHAQAA